MDALIIAFKDYTKAREALEDALKLLEKTGDWTVRLKGNFERVEVVPRLLGDKVRVDQKVRDVGAGAQVTGLKIDTLR